jgi:hypothetical protein
MYFENSQCLRLAFLALSNGPRLASVCRETKRARAGTGRGAVYCLGREDAFGFSPVDHLGSTPQVLVTPRQGHDYFLNQRSDGKRSARKISDWSISNIDPSQNILLRVKAECGQAPSFEG